MGGEEGGEGMLRHRAPRLLASRGGVGGGGGLRVCHLGAVRVNTLHVCDVSLPLGKPRSCDLERCAVEPLSHRAGRHGHHLTRLSAAGADTKRGRHSAALRKSGGPAAGRAARGPPGRHQGGHAIGPPPQKSGGPKGRPSRPEGPPEGGQRAAHRAALPPSPLCGMRGQLEIGPTEVIFAHFFGGGRVRCTFPAAPWPYAASPGSPSPRTRKNHHLPPSGS